MKITQSKAKKMMAIIKIEVAETDYSEKVKLTIIKFPNKNKTNFFNNFTNRLGLIYSRHFLNFHGLFLHLSTHK